MSGLRSLVLGELNQAGAMAGEAKLDGLRREAFAIGKRLLPRLSLALGGGDAALLTNWACSLGLAETALPRLLGFGWQQTDGLAELARTPYAGRREAAWLGGVFNLGTAVFDHICDHHPKRAQVLLAKVTPEFLEAQIAGKPQRATLGGDLGIRLLIVLITGFLRQSRILAREVDMQEAFARQIRAMYDGERFAAQARRDSALPSLRVWRELHRKSALPMGTMALLALLPCRDVLKERRTRVVAAARLAGEAIWIADDLADVREDFQMECWSRPLWRMARESGALPADANATVRRLIKSGIALDEARRLGERLVRLRQVVTPGARSFLWSIQAAVHAWTQTLPA